MDCLLAWTDEYGRITTAPFIASLVVLIVGEYFLFCELSGRVLGTYVRTLPRIVLRNIVVWLTCAVLAVPFLLALTRTDTGTPIWLLLSTLFSLLIIVQFLFPFRFGIRRIDGATGAPEEAPLAPGVVLRHTAVEVTLPPGSPGALRCLVLSDLHCLWQFNVNKLRAALAALPNEPYDMVFVLGDLGESPKRLPEVMQAIASLRPRYGVFCVRGNHDFEHNRPGLIARLAEENSIVLLSNTAHLVPELGLEIVGLECPWHGSALSARPGTAFAIGLTHTPDNIMAFSRLDVPLALAGHTHGGKIRLPWIGSFPVPSKYTRFLDEGWFQLGNTRLYISPGLRHFPGLLGRPGVLVELTITDPAHPS